MLRVGVNGYGTIGKRVADAVAAQPDMTVVGVAKRSVDATARSAVAAGYSLYRPAAVLESVADEAVGDDSGDDVATSSDLRSDGGSATEGAGAGSFGSAGEFSSTDASDDRVPVVGTVEDLVAESDVVVDATPGGVGAENASLYEAHDTPAIFQGAESPDVAEASFNSRANFDDAVGADSTRVVSCNTTGLSRLLAPLDEHFGVERVRATLVRRGGDPAQPDRGPIDDVLPDPVSLPSHHGADLQTVLPDLDVDTMALKVPATRMHLHAVNVTLGAGDDAAADSGSTSDETDADAVRSVLAAEPRLFLVPGSFQIESCGGLKELAKDAGRPRGDVWENCVWADSIAVRDGELFCFQAIHQEADVVPENVDAIRAVADVCSAECSRSTTNEALGIDRPTGAAPGRQRSVSADD